MDDDHVDEVHKFTKLKGFEKVEPKDILKFPKWNREAYEEDEFEWEKRNGYKVDLDLGSISLNCNLWKHESNGSYFGFIIIDGLHELNHIYIPSFIDMMEFIKQYGVYFKIVDMAKDIECIEKDIDGFRVKTYQVSKLLQRIQVE